MMSTLQAAAAQAYDVPTPFAILSNNIQINPDSESRSSDRISSKYSSQIFSDDEDPSDFGLGEKTPPGCSSPTEEYYSSESEEEEIREIKPAIREQLLRLGEIIDRDKEEEEQMTYADRTDINTHASPSGSPGPDLMDIALDARPQQVVEDESSSDSEMEHPLDYKEEFKLYVDSDDDDEEFVMVLPPTPKQRLRVPKLKPTIVKKQSPKRKPINNKNKFWNQLQEFKQQHANGPNQYYNYQTIDYYVATPEKTTKSCSICKQKANPIQHMQAVTWWGDKRGCFDAIDIPAIDACSTCFDTWVGHHKDSAKKGFLESTSGGNTFILRAPEVKDFFGAFKSQSLYVKVRN